MKFTPPQVARLYCVGPDKVMAWVRSGELQAINVARRVGGRPRYLIDEAALKEFERKRMVVPKPTPPRRRVRRTDVVEYF